MSKYMEAGHHKFEKFLKFLEIKTLIITDLDSTKEELKFNDDGTPSLNTDGSQKKSNIKCKVSEGNKTSNPTLTSWIPGKADLTEIINTTNEDKIKDNFFRVAYQVEENGHTGRSFEDAFILANYEDQKDENDNIINESIILKKKFKSLDKTNIEQIGYWDIAEYIDKNDKKTDFAFDIMMLKDFNIPKYIQEALIWLSK